MNKKARIARLGLITYWALLPWSLSAQAQDPYTGIWEGNFMEQFKTAILLDQQENGKYHGKILMYSGESRIQDDELSKISIENQRISFYIAAKETSFQGQFNETNTGFSGHLIFPDNSRHLLSLKKFEKDSLAVDADDRSFKEKIRQSFPVEEIKSDFRELINKLREHHPRLYSYSSEDSFEKKAAEILESLDTTLSLEAYYCRIAPLVAAVKCSHTGIRLPRQYQQSIHDHGLFFPLELYIQDNKAYSLSTPGNPGAELEAGCEIRAINGRPAYQIIEELLSLIPAEGNNKTRKYQELNRDFHTYFHMLDPAEVFTVEYVSSNAKRIVELDAIPYSSVFSMKASALSEAVYSFQLHSDPEAGYLKLSTFGIRNMDDYFAFLDSVFLQMKESELQDLILDLRDNQGGHPIFAAQLFSYLTDKGFIYFQRNRDIRDFEPLYQPMQPNPNHYGGRLYVLVNGNCLSTTGHLISLLKFHTDAIFMGEDPGSTYLCNDFSTQIRLTNTGIDLNIPRTTFITAVTGYNEGEVFPLDHEIEISVQDILAESDTYTSFVYQIIQKNGKNQLVRF